MDCARQGRGPWWALDTDGPRTQGSEPRTQPSTTGFPKGGLWTLLSPSGGPGIRGCPRTLAIQMGPCYVWVPQFGLRGKSRNGFQMGFAFASTFTERHNPSPGGVQATGGNRRTACLGLSGDETGVAACQTAGDLVCLYPLWVLIPLGVGSGVHMWRLQWRAASPRSVIRRGGRNRNHATPEWRLCWTH